MDNLLRILDRFPESLDVLPGVPRQQGVATRKCKMADVGMVCEDGDEYREKGYELVFGVSGVLVPERKTGQYDF